MFETYRLIWGVLTTPERKRLVFLMVLTVLMSLFELIGVAGVLPFLSVLNDPTLLDTNPLLVQFAKVIGSTDVRGTTIALGLAVFALIIVSMAVRALVTYAQIRYSLMRAYSLSTRMLRDHVSQDYVWHLTRNSADLGQSILSEVDLVIRESVLPSVLVVPNILMVFLIGGLLFWAEPAVAVGATSILMGVYLVVFLALRRKLGEVGRLRLEANGQRFQVIQEVTGGLKEVKVMGLEDRSIQRFRHPAEVMAKNQTLGLVIARLPRFALEAASYGGFILMVLVLVLINGEDIGNLVPLLGLIGISATKLFPALQQIFQQLSSMKFSKPALIHLHARIPRRAPKRVKENIAPLKLTKQLELSNITFQYPEAKISTLKDFSVTISAFQSIGIVGSTGAGKTTVIDIILGLLAADSGEMRVDGQRIDEARKSAWQKNIGYVPQQIFLTDDSVANNIAFGAGEDGVDLAAVERAARIANLHDFITQELPEGYATKVGERGVRMSGGQRQRIGIARALYHDPDVLILDEATSALDNRTEQAVMDAIDSLAGKKTIIMIAHRLTTLKSCDNILLLNRGHLEAQGTYDKLLEVSADFRQMANPEG